MQIAESNVNNVVLLSLVLITDPHMLNSLGMYVAKPMSYLSSRILFLGYMFFGNMRL